MKCVKTLALLMAVAFLAFSCGGGDDDKNPTNSGGASSSSGTLETHSSAPNTTVTEQNVQQVTEIVNMKAWEVFGQALSEIEPKTAKPAVNLNGRVDGETGYAQVNGTLTYTMSGQTLTSTNYNFTCTYYNYSDDNQLWLGGAVTYTGKVDMTDYQNFQYDIKLAGGFRFNGTYAGTQDFTTNIVMTGQNISWTSTAATTSGGKTFNSTIKYPPQ